MTVDIPTPLVTATNGAFQICARHGEQAAKHQRTVFRSYTPGWVYLLFLVGVLPFVIVAFVLQKRIKAPAWPFCRQCFRLRNRRLLAGAGVVVLAILGVIGFSVVLQDSSYGLLIVLVFVLLLIIGLALLGSAGRSGIASGQASRDGATVRIRRPHPRFAEHVAAVHQAAVQQAHAQQGQLPTGYVQQQGYVQPQPGQ